MIAVFIESSSLHYNIFWKFGSRCDTVENFLQWLFFIRYRHRDPFVKSYKKILSQDGKRKAERHSRRPCCSATFVRIGLVISPKTSAAQGGPACKDTSRAEKSLPSVQYPEYKCAEAAQRCAVPKRQRVPDGPPASKDPA